MARSFAYDVDTNPVQDPAVETLPISRGNKTDNNLHMLLARQTSTNVPWHLYSLTTSGTWTDEATVADSRDAISGPVQIQGIGSRGLATLDRGDGSNPPILRFWKQPDPILVVGPRASKAYFG